MYEETKMRFSLLLIMTIFSLFSCDILKEKELASDVFEAKKYVDWAYTHKLSIVNQHYFNVDQPISRPYLTWQLLAKFSVLGGGGDEAYSECLFYKVPYVDKKRKKEKIFGQILSKRIPTDSECNVEDKFLKKDLVTEVERFKIFFSNQKILAKNSKREVPPFMLTINYLKKGKIHWSSFPLINLNSENIKWEIKKDKSFLKNRLARYSSIERDGLFKGGYFWSNLEREVTDDFRVGLAHQKYFDGKAIRCETWSKSCRKKEASFCQNCRWGWYEVIGGKCERFNDKFCGQDNCGTVGWPACPKGLDQEKISYLKGHCQRSKERAFCQKGLQKVCDGDGVVICL
tara:strand:- start:12766 stop:13797 length:1032 start_codon:yes stop_codon:yes gene_type:complete